MHGPVAEKVPRAHKLFVCSTLASAWDADGFCARPSELARVFRPPPGRAAASGRAGVWVASPFPWLGDRQAVGSRELLFLPVTRGSCVPERKASERGVAPCQPRG